MRRLAAAIALSLCILPAVVPCTGETAAVAEPEGYRNEDYRAATPATLTGAKVLSTPQVEALWRSGTAAFVDVLPRPPRPANLPPGTIWREKPRLDIPGSVWLPDTGYGALAAVTEDYFRRGLDRASGGDRDRLLVVYCQRTCWHSWNAAKRALVMGYRNVAWYPDGTEGWEERGLPLEPAIPQPRPSP
jgi:PQQ-dependent catabolism-associated CXXCW motif protein